MHTVHVSKGSISVGSLLLTLLVAAPMGVLQECTMETDADGDEWTVEDGDCDDANADVYPGAPEACDGADQDCDGVADNGAVCESCVGVVDANNAPYLFCSTATSWHAAAESCAGYGYHLVEINDSDEAAWVTEAISTYMGGSLAWIGLSDEASEGSFVWEDGSSPTYTSWSSGEPNNSHGGECGSMTEEDCVATNWGSAGSWNDFPCECTERFVCELY